MINSPIGVEEEASWALLSKKTMEEIGFKLLIVQLEDDGGMPLV